MDRRHFLRLALGSAALTASWRLWSLPAGSTDSRLILVFLRGAYDSLSAVVPYNDPFYYEARPTLAIPRPNARQQDSSILLDNRWALHPVLGDSLLPFWSSEQLAFVPFSGTGFVSRSHFQAQDWVEFGLAPSDKKSVSTGFLNRLLVELKASPMQQRGVSFTQALPPSLRGDISVANSPVRLAAAQNLDDSYEQLLLNLYQGHSLEKIVREGLGLRQEIRQELKEEMVAASRGAAPASGFALDASRIGNIMQEHPEYNVGFVDIGGWDTHNNQGAVQGDLAKKLAGLGNGLDALASSLGDDWNKTLVVVISEFGRTFRENGSKGTDHGHGSTLWIMGGGLKGGRICGEQQLLTAATLHEQRDVPVLNEYRNVLGGLFAQLYGFNKANLERIFPQSNPVDLKLL